MKNVFLSIGDNLSKLLSRGKAKENIKALEETVQTMEKEIISMQEENKNLAKETEEYKQKVRNFDLVNEALKAKPDENKFIKEFASLIEDDYKVGLCNNERGSNGAENIRQLDNILNEIRLIANCPELHSKSIGAIGGGFSSGKSSFINSFFIDSHVKLAVGIKPVTAIPSYVINNKKSEVNGVSFRGGKFPISLDMYKEISHDFMKTFDFDLKEIIKYATVLVPMDNKYFEHLCLIDTPGYNPPNSGNTENDLKTAYKYIGDADFLIWTIGIDTNGTIPKSDIDFLIKLEDFGINKDRHLYIVANKAQRKTQENIEAILDQFEETLDDNDISYEGISAYNSQKKELHSYRKRDLFSFLEEHNKSSKRYAELKRQLFNVFKGYFIEANHDFDKKDEKRKEVKKLILQAFAGGNISIDDDDESVKLEAGLNDLLQYFQPKEQKEIRLKRIQDLRDKFMDCLDNFCDKVGIERNVENFCQYCGKTIESGKKVCSKCESEHGNKSSTVKNK